MPRLPQGRGCDPAAGHPRGRRCPSELRLSPGDGAREPPKAQQGCAGGERQADAAHHAGARPDAGSAHGSSSRPHPRRRRDRAALEHALVLGPSRTALPGRGRRAGAVRPRRLRPQDHRLVGDHDRRYGRNGARPDAGLRRVPLRRDAHPVEWLSDNGSAYIANPTQEMATALWLRLAFTPVRSPQSNGISEAFVKTLHRDYAKLATPRWRDRDGPAAGVVRRYNTVHPCSGLRFLSPR